MELLDNMEVTAREYLYNNINFDKIYVTKENESKETESVVTFQPSELLIRAANALRINENPVLKDTENMFFFADLELKPKSANVIGDDICVVIKDRDCLDYMRMYLIMLTDSERNILDEMLGSCLEENMIGYGTSADFAADFIKD